MCTDIGGFWGYSEIMSLVNRGGNRFKEKQKTCQLLPVNFKTKTHAQSHEFHWRQTPPSQICCADTMQLTQLQTLRAWTFLGTNDQVTPWSYGFMLQLTTITETHFGPELCLPSHNTWILLNVCQVNQYDTFLQLLQKWGRLTQVLTWFLSETLPMMAWRILVIYSYLSNSQGLIWPPSHFCLVKNKSSHSLAPSVVEVYL